MKVASAINQFIILAADILVLAAAYVCAFALRLEGQLDAYHWQLIAATLPALLICKLGALYLFGLYRGMWRYTSLRDLFNIVKATVLGSTAALTWFFLVERAMTIYRSVVIIDALLTFLGISAVRVAIRLYFQYYHPKDSILTYVRLRRSRKTMLIVGAGDAGEKVLREMRDNRQLNYDIVGFLDDDASKIGRVIHGVRILGTTEDIEHIADEHAVQEILIAVPSASSSEMRRLVGICERTGLHVRTVPGIGELIDGSVQTSTIRNVSYEDLLGRESIHLDTQEIGRVLRGKRILVTGAGGSIGSELCRHVARFDPDELVLLDRTENNLYHIDLDLRDKFPALDIVTELADIQKLPKLLQICRERRPQVVFHAAAFKHVPMLELHPWEAVTNNILGTQNVLRASDEAGAERFVLVSTDKAVRPTNVMGASKRVAELLTVCHQQNGMRCMTVRFGNVVGSDGSVVPLFKKQIERGGPVTVTHEEVTRYFMTIPEASQLILQAGAMGEGGETFILKMGDPIKIIDLARDLIRLSGFEPDVDILIKITGLRPGEKLYEELITEGDGIVPTPHEKILVLRGQVCHIDQWQPELEALRLAAAQRDSDHIRALLHGIVPEYELSTKSSNLRLIREIRV
jgi:FlaA1/EpsC-like NDP-sugar epimerase